MQDSVPVSVIASLLGTSAFVLAICSTLAYCAAATVLPREAFLCSVASAVVAALLFTLLVSKVLKTSFLDFTQRPMVLVTMAALFLLAILVQELSSFHRPDTWLLYAAPAFVAVLAGFLLAALLLLWGGIWGSLFSTFEDKRICFYALCLAFLIAFAGLGVILSMNLSRGILGVASLALVCATVALEATVRVSLPSPAKSWEASVSSDSSATMLRLRPYSAAFTLAAFGLLLVQRIGFRSTALGFALGGSTALCVLLAFTSSRKEIPHFSIESWTFFVAELAVLLAYAFAPHALFAAVLGGAFSVYYAYYLLAIDLTIARGGFNPYAHFSLRISRPLAGAVLGLGLTLACTFLLPVSEQTAASIITLAAFSVLCLNHMKDPHYWQEWASLYRYANDIEETSSDTELGVRALSVLRWEDTCRKLADDFDLSDREKDVFILLAKGRNAALIAEKLFISVNTARTHIYRIYSKTGLKNQQELISLVEEKQIEAKKRLAEKDKN